MCQKVAIVPTDELFMGAETKTKADDDTRVTTAVERGRLTVI
jgi:hypothetical protein